MTDPERFHVEFPTTDDAALDDEVRELEEEPHTLEEIRAACLRLRVRAWVFRGEEMVDVVIPEDERECSARYADVTERKR